MDKINQDLRTLQDIKKMMERSSRFISLSGISGIVAGLCALIGAFLANIRINLYFQKEYPGEGACPSCLKKDLIIIAVAVFLAAFMTATLFTFFKSKKENIPIWGAAARRLLWNTMIPMAAGGFFLWRMMQLNQYDLLAAGCLIFYGLALVNGSKYTLGEVKYLGYAQILLGIINLWMIQKGILFWAIGFGLFHIIYGLAMWWKYDRVTKPEASDVPDYKMER